MRKGFVIMMDVVFAVLLAVGMLAVASRSLDTGQIDVWKEDALHKLAEDVILVLDKNGTLASIATASVAAGNATLNSSLAGVLPTNIAANITFTVYTDANNDNVFETRTTYNAQTPASWQQAQVAVAKRVYTRFFDKNSTANEFGVAEIRLWTVVG